MCWHKFNKWKVVDIKQISVFGDSSDIPWYRKEVMIQTRTCQKCGIKQVNKKEIKF
jgi:C4-type Zn-finger protein